MPDALRCLGQRCLVHQLLPAFKALLSPIFGRAWLPDALRCLGQRCLVHQLLPVFKALLSLLFGRAWLPDALRCLGQRCLVHQLLPALAVTFKSYCFFFISELFIAFPDALRCLGHGHVAFQSWCGVSAFACFGRAPLSDVFLSFCPFFFPLFLFLFFLYFFSFFFVIFLFIAFPCLFGCLLPKFGPRQRTQIAIPKLSVVRAGCVAQFSPLELHKIRVFTVFGQKMHFAIFFFFCFLGVRGRP